MEFRKRFRADISDSYIQSKFSRKKPKKEKPEVNDGPEFKTVQYIPSDMLPAPKLQTREPRTYDTKTKGVKLTREQVFMIEKANMKKRLEKRIDCGRGARMLEIGFKPKKQDKPLDVEDSQLVKTIQAKRKNYSREYLDTFRQRAADLMKGSTSLETAHSNPKLDVKPGADEIVL